MRSATELFASPPEGGEQYDQEDAMIGSHEDVYLPPTEIAANDDGITEHTQAIAETFAQLQNTSSVDVRENVRMWGKEEFEAQLMQEHSIPFGESTITYAKVEPLPEMIKNPNWVVFVGGFNSEKEGYYDELFNLAHSGRKVLFINPETDVQIEDANGPEITKDIPVIIRSEAAALHAVLAHEGIAAADFVAHSRGSAVTSTFLAEHPGIGVRVLLDSPAGLTGKEPAIKLLTRSVLEFGGERLGEIRAGVRRLTGRGAYTPDHPTAHFEKRLLDHIGWKLSKEIPAIAHTDIRPLLEHIRGNGYEDNTTKPPEVILLNGNSDHIFTQERITEALGEIPTRYIDRWANYIEKDARHGKIARPHPGIIPQVFANDATNMRRPSAIAHLLSEE